MNPVSTLHGRVLTPFGWVRGDITFDQRIVSINSAHADPRGDDEVPLILPGFIDLHVHGGAGVDIMQGGDTARTVARAKAPVASARCRGARACPTTRERSRRSGFRCT